MADLPRKDGQRKRPHGPVRPTIFSVAELAGVSTTAVSKILNHSDSHRYSKAVEARVFEVCETVGYRPSSMARSLAKQTNPGIGILCQSLTDANLVRAVDRAVEVAAARGLHVVISTKPGEIAWENLISEERVGWIIALGDWLVTETDQLRSRHIMNRIAAISGEMPAETLPVAVHVFWDDKRCGILAVEHLAELGHREIAILGGYYLDPQQAPGKIGGAYERARELGIEAHWVTDTGEAPGAIPQAGHRMAQHVLETYPEVTAIICRQDYHAFGVYRELHRAGKQIPQDMAVVGNLNLQEFLYFDPPLTSVDVPMVEAIERVMEFIVSDGPLKENRQVDLTEHITLVSRGSTVADAGTEVGTR